MIPEEQRKFLAENVPKHVGNDPVDLYKWLDAVDKNPDRSLLFPVQISSVRDLKKRIEETL